MPLEALAALRPLVDSGALAHAPLAKFSKVIGACAQWTVAVYNFAHAASDERTPPAERASLRLVAARAQLAAAADEVVRLEGRGEADAAAAARLAAQIEKRAQLQQRVDALEAAELST